MKSDATSDFRSGPPAHLLLAAIVSASDDAIISKTLDGEVTSWNPAAEQIFGFGAEEMIGQSIFKIVPPDLVGEEKELLAKVRRGERIDHLEARRQRKDGSIVFLSLTISPVRHEAGEIGGCSTVARDMTEQRAAQSARAWLAAIVDSSDDAVISKDLNGIITSWNGGAQRIFGYHAREIVGRSVLNLIPPELHGDEPMILSHLRRGERIDHFETTRMRKDGTRLKVSLTVSPIRDATGKLIGASKVARDITAQQEAEVARNRLAAIVDSSDDAIISKDLNGIITSWNAAAERLFGYPAAEIIGQPVTTLLAPGEAAEEPKVLARLASGERLEHHETLRRHKNGTLIPVSLSISAVRDGSGRVVGAAKILRDIRRQKRDEVERLLLLEREKEARGEAEALIEAARGLSSDLDLAATVQKATDVATKLTGAKFGAFFYNTVNERQESYVLYALSGAPREAFGQFGLPRNTAVFGPTFRGEGTVRLADVMADPRYGQNAPHHGMPKGHPPVRSYLAVPVISRSGEVIGGMFFGHPEAGVFTERAERIVAGIAAHAAIAIDNAKLYARAQATASRLQFSLAALDLGDWTWNASNDEMRMSDRAAAIYGFEPGVVGKREDLRARLQAEDRDRARDAATRAVETGTDYDIEYRIQHPTLGVRWVFAKGRPQTDEHGKVQGMMGVVQDITERKRIELELRESREKLQSHAETLERHVAERTAQLQETIGELEAFSYSVSHDMRTPLRSMQGYAERLLRIYRDKLDAEAVHHLERINKNAERLELLVRDVLTYSRVAKAEIVLQPVDLAAFLDVLLPSMPEIHREGVTVKTVRPLPAVRAHEAYLSQIFTNLVGNAVKFKAEGRHCLIEISAETKDGQVTIRVSDNGIGIAPEHFERIFQIFGRVYADKKYQGTGIGLSIVRKAVQRMGGQVAVESHFGQGSCFMFTLQSA